MGYHHGICQSNVQLLYKKLKCFILVYRDFMSQVLKIVLTVHCVSIQSIKLKESFRISLIEERKFCIHFLLVSFYIF